MRAWLFAGRRWPLLCVALAVLASTFVIHADAADQVRTARPTVKVLFIGNSLTYYNNLSEIVAGIAAGQRGGPLVTPTAAVRGGATLKWHLENGTAVSLLTSTHWDFVVLQEQSMLGGASVDGKPVVGDPSAFYASVRDWVTRIRGVGAKPLLFMTWARRIETPDIWRQQEQLANAYTTIGRELNVPVAPVGLAWAEARRRFISLDLHIWDGLHPTPAGSYLAACVLYSTLAGRSPLGAPGVVRGHSMYETGPSGDDVVIDRAHLVPLVELPGSLATELQKVAWDVVSQKR